MKTAFLFFFLLFFQNNFAQPYNQGVQSLIFSDASRLNRLVPTTIYYPSVSNGSASALPNETKKYPLVVFGHGFSIGTAAYKWLADSLVRYGFIVAFPNTETGFNPSHTEFGKDLAFLCQRITSLNDSSGSFFFNRILNKSAVGGHSMGGGCSFLAMNYNTAIQVLFNMAAAETNPTATNAANFINKPALIFTGSADCIVTPAVTQGMYLNIPYTCKTLINITGALHCQFSSNDATCVTGQVLSGCNNSSLTSLMVQQKTISLLLPFLQHYLFGDCTAKTIFSATLLGLTGATSINNCTADPLSPCIATPVEIIRCFVPVTYIYPMPVSTSGKLFFKSKKMMTKIMLYDQHGKLVNQTACHDVDYEMHLPCLVPGIYTVRIIYADSVQNVQRIIVE
jgi:dienelactone hydrolase